MTPVLRRTLALLAALVAVTWSRPAAADPPSRVARLAYASGSVSLSPAGEDEWVMASINRPLTTGDRLWVDDGARAEVQVGGAAMRMDGGTSVGLLNMDDRIAQVELAQGVLKVRVRYLRAGQVFEIDTPNLAFTIGRPGDYRIEVDLDDDATSVVVRGGQGEAWGEGAAYVVDSRQAYRFYGAGLRDYDTIEMPRTDDLDRWAADRDRRSDRSISARYVSRDAIGYEDLDAYGSWRDEPEWGHVWVPTRVARGWAPYHDGHWAWVDPWGWSWVDDEPWGFTVSHYGRWANTRGTWVWVPGPVQSRAFYAPALVVFVGGADFQVSISGGNVGAVAWFPLGPRDVYRPAYQVSRGYFEGINRSNTVINNTTIINVYNNSQATNIVYANQRVQGAVVAVPATVFVRSQPVSRAAVPVRRELVEGARVSPVAAVAPVQESVHGSGRAGGRPPARALERPVVARSAPPPAPAGFAAQERQLSAKPGRPLDEATRTELTRARPAEAPKVRVVTPATAEAPKARPPPVARDRGKDRGKDRPGNPPPPEQRGNAREQPTPVAPPAAPAPADVRPKPEPAERRGEPAHPPVNVVPAPRAERRGGEEPGRREEAAKPEPRGSGDPRGQRGEREAVRPPAAAPPVATPPVAQPPPNERKGQPGKAAPAGPGRPKADDDEAKLKEERKAEKARLEEEQKAEKERKKRAD